MIMARYTPEEAAFLTGMPFSSKSLEELAAMKGMEPGALRVKLDALARKGILFRTVGGDTVRYRPNEAAFVFYRAAFWPGGTDETSKALAPLTNRYYLHGFSDNQAFTSKKALRVLPIEETVKDPKAIVPYEQAARVLDAVQYFAVSVCPCRHRKNLDPHAPNCRHSTEVCLHFDKLGRYTVENGMGREITREQTEEILRQCAEEGLVHGIQNWVEGIDTICNCCKCCCNFFEAYHVLKHAEGMTPSSYWARSHPDTCIGCGLCVKRCPMDAITLEDCPEAKDRITTVAANNQAGKKELKNKTGRVSKVDQRLCVGCGVCAYKCPSASLVLELREGALPPPANVHDWMRQVAAELLAARERQGALPSGSAR